LRATAFAQETRVNRLSEADQTVIDTKAEESVARDRYHSAERIVREKHDS
jgi:hypothetical protein